MYIVHVCVCECVYLQQLQQHWMSVCLQQRQSKLMCCVFESLYKQDCNISVDWALKWCGMPQQQHQQQQQQQQQRDLFLYPVPSSYAKYLWNHKIWCFLCGTWHSCATFGCNDCSPFPFATIQTIAMPQV